MNLSALAESEAGRAVSGLTEANVALTRSGLFSPSDHLRISFVPAFPLGTPPSDQLRRFTAGKQFYLTSCLEQSAIAQHGVHDDCEPAGKSNASLLETTALGDFHGTIALQQRSDRLRSALDLFGNELPPIFINDADLGAFHRQVQSGIHRGQAAI